MSKSILSQANSVNKSKYYSSCKDVHHWHCECFLDFKSACFQRQVILFHIQKCFVFYGISSVTSQMALHFTAFYLLCRCLLHFLHCYQNKNLSQLFLTSIKLFSSAQSRTKFNVPRQAHVSFFAHFDPLHDDVVNQSRAFLIK